jgi:hypothetical protein
VSTVETLKDDYTDNPNSKRDMGKEGFAPDGSWQNARAKNHEEFRSENKRKTTRNTGNHYHGSEMMDGVERNARAEDLCT